MGDIGDICDIRDVCDIRDIHDIHDICDIYDIHDIHDIRDICDIHNIHTYSGAAKLRNLGAGGAPILNSVGPHQILRALNDSLQNIICGLLTSFSIASVLFYISIQKTNNPSQSF